VGTPKIISILNRDASDAQVTTWETDDADMKNWVMSDVSSMVESLNTTKQSRDIRFTSFLLFNYNISTAEVKPHLGYGLKDGYER
jgi:hypothetical protein